MLIPGKLEYGIQCSNRHRLPAEDNLSVTNSGIVKYTVVPLSKAMRNSRLRCSSLINSSFCRKRAMRSSSRYCFSFLSCSVAPLVLAAPERESEWAVHWLIEETEEEDEDEGWDRLLWELCQSKQRKG